MKMFSKFGEIRSIFSMLFLFGGVLSAHAGLKTSLVRFDVTKVSINKLAELGLPVDHIESGVQFEEQLYPHQIQKLNENGIPYEIVIEDFTKYLEDRYEEESKISPAELRKRSGVAAAPVNFKGGSMGGYMKISEYYADLDKMRSLYPNLISEKFSIGKSLENRDIWAVRISNAPDSNQSNKKNVGYNAMIHANENPSGASIMYYMWYLLENYATDAKVKQVVDGLNQYFVPVVNPDGVAWNFEYFPKGGGTQRKNRRPHPGVTGSDNGVDINRNFDQSYGTEPGSSSKKDASNYRGTHVWSEPEAVVYRDFSVAKQFTHIINGHSSGNKLIHPWGVVTNGQEYPENHAAYKALSQRMLAKNSDWEYGRTLDMLSYSAAGTARCWNHTLGAMSFVAEIGKSKWPSTSLIIPLAASTQNIYLELALDAVEKNPPAALSQIPAKLDNHLKAAVRAANGMINVNYELNEGTGSYFFSVHDLSGKEYKRIRLVPSNTSVNVPLNGIRNGLYMAKVEACSGGACKPVFSDKMMLGM